MNPRFPIVLLGLIAAMVLASCSSNQTGVPKPLAAQRLVVAFPDLSKARSDGFHLVGLDSMGKQFDSYYSPDVVVTEIRTKSDVQLNVRGQTADGTAYIVNYPITSVKSIAKRAGSVDTRVALDSLRTTSCSSMNASSRHAKDFCNPGDPGPCPDCSGPMAPGGFLACHTFGSCGDGFDDGVPPQGGGIPRWDDAFGTSCYYDFQAGNFTLCLTGNNNYNNIGGLLRNLAQNWGIEDNGTQQFYVNCAVFSTAYPARAFVVYSNLHGGNVELVRLIPPNWSAKFEFPTRDLVGNTILSLYEATKARAYPDAVCNASGGTGSAY